MALSLLTVISYRPLGGTAACILTHANGEEFGSLKSLLGGIFHLREAALGENLNFDKLQKEKDSSSKLVPDIQGHQKAY